MKRWMFFIPALGLLALAIFSVIKLGQGPQTKSDLFEGAQRPLPAVNIETLLGDRLVWEEGTKGPQIINLWATWCAPCKVEHPVLMDMSQTMAIIGIAYKDDETAIKKMLNEGGDPFSVVGLDPDGMYGLSLGINAVPETFLVDTEGNIVKQYRGALKPEEALEIKQLYADMGGALLED